MSALVTRKAFAGRRRWAARWSVGVADSPEIGTSGRERGTARLMQFSDGVFTIAATILVLEIHRPADAAHLSRGLLELWPSYLAYALTFLLIGQVWANHHAMFDHIRAADWVLLLFNVLLLMTVAFLPFSASVLAGSLHDHAGQRTAVVFYGGSFALGSVFFFLIWRHARRARLLGETTDDQTEKALTRRFGPAAPLYLAGALAGAVMPLLGLVLFTAPAIFSGSPSATATPLAASPAKTARTENQGTGHCEAASQGTEDLGTPRRPTSPCCGSMCRWLANVFSSTR